jgi:hypothetical protein
MGDEQLNPFERGERKRLLDDVDRAERDRSEKIKGAEQRYQDAKKSLEDFNRQLRTKGIKI